MKFKVAGEMQNRFSVTFGCAILLLAQTATSLAADRIQAFVNPTGRVVFTNLGENSESVVPAETSRRSETSVSGVPAALSSLVHVISSSHGVDPALVAAVMRTESGFNRWAVSPKGARGLMQLIPATGHRFGVRDFFDPQQNIEGGVRYLKFLLNKFEGDLDLSLAAYNAGENLVEKLGRIPSIPETMNYVRKVRSIYMPAAPDQADSQQGEAPRIFRKVDRRGIVHFSNIEPPN
jgi:soluble lytic murein transglycosylase-like protein